MPTATTSQRSFTASTFSFLRDLAANNDRDWFNANKQRYEDQVRGPARAFIRDFKKPLAKISPHFVADARKSGGSLFRIHRDTRFSKDKSPYKTHAGIHFRHEEGPNVHTPGFYLHLQPREVFMGCGIWHPDGPTLAKIRAAIAADGAKWKKARDAAAFKKHYALAGDSLKRPPRGFDPEHPYVVDLKRKDFIGVAQLSQKAVTAPGFLQEFTTLCKAGMPLQRFLCGALGLAC